MAEADAAASHPQLAVRVASCEPLSISQITLSHFRNYADIRLVCGASPVILTGPNGSGKTNLIEAISLLVPGRGLRRAACGVRHAEE